jgi:hypothetical protein
MAKTTYTIRVQTTSGIEEHNPKTSKEADELFSSLVRWDAPKTRLYIEMQKCRDGEEIEVRYCYLNEELGKAAKNGNAQEVLQRLKDTL